MNLLFFSYVISSPSLNLNDSLTLSQCIRIPICLTDTNMRRVLILLTIVFFVYNKSNGQKVHAEPDDFKKIFERPLLVEILEVNPNILKHLQKISKKHPEAEGDYREFIRLYNENIKLAVDKFWVLNKEVRYATTTQIDSLAHTKYYHYACLYYSEAAEQFVDYSTGKKLVVPTLNYSRLENFNKKVDYSVFLPVSFLKPHDEYIETDLIFGVQFIQRNIEYMINNNRKMSATSYAKQFGKHCSHLQTKVLLLDKALMEDSLSVNEIKNHYKYQFNFTTPDKINHAVEEAHAENAYLVSLPYELPTLAGPGTSAQIVCMRLIIDAQTGNILSSLGTSLRENQSKIFLTEDFAVCETCQ